MASKKGQVTLRGRFSKGSVVTLTKVAGEHTLRPQGGEDVATKTVEEKDGASFVQFTGVEEGARYIVHGINDGSPLEVRARGRAADDDSEVLAQAPVQPDRVRLTDGTWADDAPTKESAPSLATTFPGQRQVKKGQVQRSDTPRGTAHPVDPDREEPVRRQESVPDGTVQMSDTRPREVDGEQVAAGGEATEIILGPQRQEDTKSSTVQRSSTPTGVAQPLPAGDMVQAQEMRDSSQTRESRGDNTRGAAEPLEVKGARMGAPTGATDKESEKRTEELRKSEREAATTATPIDQPADDNVDLSGLDAQGQPLAEDAARAAGVKPAEKPGDTSERPVSKSPRRSATDRSAAAKKAARTRKRNEKKAEADAQAAENSKREAATRTGAATTTNTTANKE
jgi:hypothetical protein